MYNCAKSN